jgi:hypothetical protein
MCNTSKTHKRAYLPRKSIKLSHNRKCGFSLKVELYIRKRAKGWNEKVEA